MNIGSVEKSSWSAGTTARTSIVWRKIRSDPPGTPLSKCTTRSIEFEKTFLTTLSGTFSPAIRAALTRASKASLAELAWMVQVIPHPALTARVSSKASAPRTSPTTMRSGLIASVTLTRSRRLISPVPSSEGGLAS